MEQYPAAASRQPHAIGFAPQGGSGRQDKMGLSLAARAPLRSHQVLVVEDSWHIAGAIKTVVETVGMTVVGPAATLADAEKLMASNALDMAVVDINLQGELTYGLIEKLIASKIAVVIVSGYEVLPEIADRADAVLKKPIRAGVLLATLQRIAGKQSDS